MDEKNTDIFQLSENERLSEKNNNFFLNNDVDLPNVCKSYSNMQHLNDYDYNIMQKGAYKDVTDDVLKMEYKISQTEKDIANVEAQIVVLKELADYDKLKELQDKLVILKEKYSNLMETYNQQVLSAKISNSIYGIYDKIIGSKLSNLKNIINDACETILKGLPDKFSSIMRIKKSLLALENINKSVDSLVSTNIPYGESADKYQTLSKYIIKANSIQSEISKYIKK